MMLFSDWARRQQGGFGGAEGGVAPTPVQTMIQDLVETFEQSLRLSEECRNLQQIAELRRQWRKESENVRAREFSARIREIEARLTSSLEAALAPLLEEAVVKKGIEEFCGVLQRHLQAASAQQLVIRAPAGLRQQLGEELESRGIAASIEEHASGEVSTSIDGAEIETDIGAWIDRLRKVAA
jgi:hypothetical protein